MRALKTGQDEVNRRTHELEHEVTQFATINNRLEDFQARLKETSESVQQSHYSTSNLMNTMSNNFNTLKKDFTKEGEYMRVARKATDNLQEEYCRIVHSVATEK